MEVLLWFCLENLCSFSLPLFWLLLGVTKAAVSLLFFTEEFAFFFSQSRVFWSQQFPNVPFYFPPQNQMSFFSARHLLFALLVMMMKFMCSAKVSEKGRTWYTWGKDQSAVMLYNFPRPLDMKASSDSHVCQPCSEQSPSVRADRAWAERTWHHQHGKTNQVIANSYH